MGGKTRNRTLLPGARRQQMPVRAARAVPVAVRARRGGDGQPSAVGDRGLQAATTFSERSAVQAHLRHVNRFQKYRQQNRERAQAVTVGYGRPSRQSRQSITTS